MIELPENPVSTVAVMDALSGIEHWSQQAADRLPESRGESSVWDGLAFTVTGIRIVSAMKEISEMLPFPDRVTRVPGARPWVQGLANVRGSLLPVIDLQVFLGGKPVIPSKGARVLVLRLHGLTTGLLVPSVHGMRHFELESRIQDARMKGALGAYVYDAFTQEKEIWPVFSMAALATDPAFRAATV